jgi:hypothetical protein
MSTGRDGSCQTYQVRTYMKNRRTDWRATIASRTDASFTHVETSESVAADGFGAGAALQFGHAIIGRFQRILVAAYGNWE